MSRINVSVIWDYFEKKNNDVDKKAKCRVCGDLYSYKGSAGNLKTHLKRVHSPHEVFSSKWSQLQMALQEQELKASKEQYELLFKESDETEKEIINIIAKNSQLISDMVKLHTDFTNVLKDRDQLHGTVDEVDCSV